MRVLVVDDEAIARRRLIRMLGALDGVEVVGEAEDGFQAREAIARLAPDVVFLDIRMPGLDGLSLALADRGVLPPVVFTTAHDEYAVRAFAAEAVDYLLKPVEPARLREAVERVRRRGAAGLDARLEAVLDRLGATAAEPPRVTARSGGTVFVFDPRDVARFSAHRKYVEFSHRGRRYLTDESLDALAARLEPWGFLRVHRSEVVALAAVAAWHQEGGSASLELADGTRVSVSRRRAAEVRRALGIAGPEE